MAVHTPAEQINPSPNKMEATAKTAALTPSHPSSHLQVKSSASETLLTAK